MYSSLLWDMEWPMRCSLSWYAGAVSMRFMPRSRIWFSSSSVSRIVGVVYGLGYLAPTERPILNAP